jgi:HEAT repeat protein
MSGWPQQVVSALNQLGYEYPGDELYIEGFTGRWGGLDRHTLVRVLGQGQGDDILLAIFAVGDIHNSESSDLLAPFLASSQPRERWASALCLGQMKDERALPVLLHMLTEFLPPDVQYAPEGYIEISFDDWRPTVALLVGEYGRLEVVPVLVQALQELRRQEQMSRIDFQYHGKLWHICQNHIVYGLGWLGQSEKLAEWEVPEVQKNVWRVYLALGYVHAHTHYPDVLLARLKNKPALRAQIVEVLEQQWGLSVEEQVRCLRDYEDESLAGP